MAVSMINKLGGSPTPISWGELYTALQQGVVDGAENNPPSFYTSKHYEVCKHYSINEHTSVPDVLLIGIETWSRLNAQEKEWLMEAVKESSEAQRKLWVASEKESLEKVKAAGVQIYYPDKSLFETKTKSMEAMFFETKTKSMEDMFDDDESVKALIKAIKNTP